MRNFVRRPNALIAGKQIGKGEHQHNTYQSIRLYVASLDKADKGPTTNYPLLRGVKQEPDFNLKVYCGEQTDGILLERAKVLAGRTCHYDDHVNLLLERRIGRDEMNRIGLVFCNFNGRRT